MAGGLKAARAGEGLERLGGWKVQGKGRENRVRMGDKTWVPIALAITEREGTMVLPTPHPLPPGVSLK